MSQAMGATQKGGIVLILGTRIRQSHHLVRYSPFCCCAARELSFIFISHA